MSFTALFDRGSSTNFFDPNIFDTSLHYTSSLTETISVSDSIAGGKSFLRTLLEGGFGMFDAGFVTPFFDPNIFDATFHPTLTVSDSVVGALIIYRNINESSILVSDSLTAIQSLIRILNETIAVSDSVMRPATFIRTILEGGYIMFDNLIFDSNIFDTSFHEILSVSDQVKGTQKLVRSISEPSISVNDSVSTIQSLFRIITEAVVVSDILSRMGIFSRAIPETVLVSELLTRQLSSFRAISEPSISASDSISANYIFHRIINENISVADMLSGTLPPGTIKFISRIKLVLDITSQLKQTLTVNSSII